MERDHQQLKKSLSKVLQKEISCARALYHSLKNESAALANVDNKLAHIDTAAKQRLIKDLQEASEARIALMKQHDLTYVPALIEEYKITANRNTELDILFIQLSEVAQQCFSENRLIGQLINRRTHLITQTLSVLSPSAEAQGLTYAESGSTAEPDNSRNAFFCLTKV